MYCQFTCVGFKGLDRVKRYKAHKHTEGFQ